MLYTSYILQPKKPTQRDPPEFSSSFLHLTSEKRLGKKRKRQDIHWTRALVQWMSCSDTAYHTLQLPTYIYFLKIVICSKLLFRWMQSGRKRNVAPTSGLNRHQNLQNAEVSLASYKRERKWGWVGGVHPPNTSIILKGATVKIC